MVEPIVNPVGLLTGLAAEGAEFEEILVCSFNQNLSFFERVLLGPCRSMGARITLLGDINMAELDPAALTQVNRRYYAGHVKAAKSFHPKLVVAVGRDRAVIAIGSGNLTIAGWLGNDEMWTIHYADAESRTSVAGAVATWCRKLPEVARVSEVSRNGLLRTADQLDIFTTDEPGLASVVSSLDTPIIDQLPVGPVDHLNLYAPFHDHLGEASRRLVERFQPAAVTVAFQPGLTSANGEALRAALPPDTEYIKLATNPYRHGKLIEWSVDGAWHALTGSANLSTAALCKTAQTGGNVELGVVAKADDSLLPTGQTSDGYGIAAVKPASGNAGRRERAVLLAATLIGSKLLVEFASALAEAGALRVASDETPPGSWDFSVAVSAGLERIEIEPVPAGSRLQVGFADTISNTIFVADPIEVLQTRVAGSGKPKTPPPEIIDLFKDPTALGKVARLLEELREQTKSAGASAPGQLLGGDATGRYTVGGWQAYLNEATDSLSPQMISFALGVSLDAAPALATFQPILTRDWDGDDPDLRADAYEDDEADDVTSEASVTVSAYQVAEATRQRCWRSIDRFAPKDQLGSLIALRLMLTFVAAGGFSPRDDSWVSSVFAVLRRFGRDDHGNSEAEAGSLAAVAVACTRSTLSNFMRTPTHGQQRRIEDEVSHLLVAAEPELVAAYADDLKYRFGSILDADDIMTMIAEIVNDDPMANSIRDAEAAGYAIEFIGTVGHVSAPAQSAEAVALRVISYFTQMESVSIRACDPANPSDWSAAIWSRPHLLVAGPAADGTGNGFVYDLKRHGLGSVAQGDRREISDCELQDGFYMPGRATPPLAQGLLDSAPLSRS